MAEYEHITHPFAPICAADARVLILGSLPSKLSRVNDFYYGNPRNRFWPVMAQVLGEAAPESIAEKTALLERHGIALWDVIVACDIRGSSDASIRNAKPVDLPSLLNRCQIEAVFTNGRTAERLFARYLADAAAGIPRTCLPSTSPANAAWHLDALCETWGAALRLYFTSSSTEEIATRPLV